MRAIRVLTVLLLAFAFPVLAQLAPEQKEHDFRNLASLYAKRYAPAAWKKQLLGVDILDIDPWLARVRASKTDLDFLEICYEYVAQLDDLHTSPIMTSNFLADSGLMVDIYEGKVLVQAINTTLLPPAQFPILVGDELLAIDGKSVNVLLEEFAKVSKFGNIGSTNRFNSAFLTRRLQNYIPRAVELPEKSTFQILHQTGRTASYEITWQKQGIPVTTIGPAPSASAPTSNNTPRKEAAESVPDYMKPLQRMRNWYSARARDAMQTPTEAEWDGFVTGVGSRAPVFAIPGNFTVRRGLAAADIHFSATYTVGNRRIGYLRIPSFQPASELAAEIELANEIAFFQQNTDGLVLDVMRNPGGGCYMLTLASYLMPQPFYFFGEELRVTSELISEASTGLTLARSSGAPKWVIDYYEFYLRLIKQAYAENRGMTGPIPSCDLTFESEPARGANGALLAYTKPMIFLTDEFSISAADIFPAMMQDNKRGPIVGMRTAGGGGSVSSWYTGFYSEFQASNTNSLVVRKDNVQTPGYPTSRYIENVGTHPDIYLNFMTRQNLLNRGLTFVQDFTGAILNEINRPR